MKAKGLIITLLFVFTICFSIVQAEVAKIRDIDKSSSFAKDAIMELAEKNVISGDQNGNFNPQKPINRVELVVLLVKVLEIDTSTAPYNPTFKDVPRNHWAYKYVEAAYREGIVTGISKTEFGINKICTREQIAVMFVRGLNLIDKSSVMTQKRIGAMTDKNAIAEWAQNEVDVALASGLMNGVRENTFAPKTNATKEQAALVLNRFIENKSNIIMKVNTEYGFNKETQLILNGDAVPAALFMLDENNNVFISDKFLGKYYLENFNLGGTHVKDSTFYYRTEDVDMTGNLENFWIKSGSQNAYKNYELIYYNTPVSPYEDEEKFKDKLINLEFTPFIQGGDLYISAKDFSNIAGITYKADLDRNKVYMEMQRVNKYPNLYNALSFGTYGQYRGEIQAELSVNMTELATKDYVRVKSNIQARVNDAGSYSYFHFNVDSKKDGKEEFAVSQIMHRDKVYLLDNDGKWFEYNMADLNIALREAALDPYSVQVQNNGSILDDRVIIGYKIYDISKIGKVSMDGIEADKYVIKLDEEALKIIYTEVVYDILKKAYNGTIVQEMEFYIADETIIRQVNRFAGQLSDANTKSKVNMQMEITSDYKNIGVEYKIEPPTADEIKQPEQ